MKSNIETDSASELPKLYTLKEVAEYLAVSLQTIKRNISPLASWKLFALAEPRG